jgi:hypothetical protein
VSVGGIVEIGEIVEKIVRVSIPVSLIHGKKDCQQEMTRCYELHF